MKILLSISLFLTALFPIQAQLLINPYKFTTNAIENGSSPMNGRIDEVGFWKRTLTTIERSNLWSGGLGTTCCPFPVQ